jgi:hypothetical protein
MRFRSNYKQFMSYLRTRFAASTVGTRSAPSYGSASSFVRPPRRSFPRMPANEANADQHPDSAKHSCNSINRGHDCGWQTVSGNMYKDEGNAAWGSHVGPPRCAVVQHRVGSAHLKPWQMTFRSRTSCATAPDLRSSGARSNCNFASSSCACRDAIRCDRDLLPNCTPESSDCKGIQLAKISRFRVAIIPNRD